MVSCEGQLSQFLRCVVKYTRAHISFLILMSKIGMRHMILLLTLPSLSAVMESLNWRTHRILPLYILKAFWMFTSLPSLMKSSQRYQTPDFCLKYPPLYSNRSFFGGFPHIAQKWSKLLGHILTRWCWIRLRPPRIWPYYERECDFRATPYFIPIFWHQCFALVKFLHGYFEVLNPEHVLQPDQPHQLVFGGAVQVLVL